MTVNTTKSLLWMTMGCLVVGTALIWFEAFQRSSALLIVTAPKPSATSENEIHLVELPALGELQTLCQHDFHQALYDPPPPPPPVMAIPPPPTPPPFTLAGTAIEPGHCRAMLLGTDGKLLLGKIGDKAEGMEVIRIERDAVTVRFQGRELTLKVEKKE